jgi:hypothetical protein
LLLAGSADRLERLIALRLRDQALAREHLSEALGRHVRSHRDRFSMIEEHDLLGLAVEQVEAAGALDARELADDLREGAATQRALEREPQRGFSDLRHGRRDWAGTDRMPLV